MRSKLVEPVPNDLWPVYRTAFAALTAEHGGTHTKFLSCLWSCYLSELSHLGHEIPDEV